MENVTDRASSKVVYVLQVNGEDKALVEAKSPSVMKKVAQLLPQNGIELTWTRDQPLVPKILTKVSTLFSSSAALASKEYMQAAMYLGLRRMEWLFPVTITGLCAAL